MTCKELLSYFVDTYNVNELVIIDKPLEFTSGLIDEAKNSYLCVKYVDSFKVELLNLLTTESDRPLFICNGLELIKNISDIITTTEANNVPILVLVDKLSSYSEYDVHNDSLINDVIIQLFSDATMNTEGIAVDITHLELKLCNGMLPRLVDDSQSLMMALSEYITDDTIYGEVVINET